MFLKDYAPFQIPFSFEHIYQATPPINHDFCFNPIFKMRFATLKKSKGGIY